MGDTEGEGASGPELEERDAGGVGQGGGGAGARLAEQAWEVVGGLSL